MEGYKTPEYYHCIDDPRLRGCVYEPEADTFLFLDALDADRERLRALAPKRCVEVGCGSGTVVTHLFAVLHSGEGQASVATAFAAVDINRVALEATSITWRRTLMKYFSPLLHGQEEDSLVCFASPPSDVSSCPSSASPAAAALHLFLGDLLTPLDTTAEEGLFDVVLFNPPYVPTSLEELQSAVEQKDTVITAAWCGGPKGRVVLDRFLRMLPRYLSREGLCYIVLIRENDEVEVASEVERAFREHLGLPPITQDEGEGGEEGSRVDRITEMTVVARRYTGEQLSVHRISYRS